MCDFSLEAYRSRKAKKGDRLVTHYFPSGTIGVCRLGEENCPTCLQVGTELGFDKPIRLRNGVTLAYTTATFVCYSVAASAHRDAIETPDGRQYSLQHLDWKQVLDVLQVPVEATATVEDVAEELGLPNALAAE